jgi:hypothetical protein
MELSTVSNLFFQSMSPGTVLLTFKINPFVEKRTTVKLIFYVGEVPLAELLYTAQLINYCSLL